MAGLYGSGRSSPDDDELGLRLMRELSEEDTGRRQGMHVPNAIWAVLVHEKGVAIWQEGLLGCEVEGNLKAMLYRSFTAPQRTCCHCAGLCGKWGQIGPLNS